MLHSKEENLEIVRSVKASEERRLHQTQILFVCAQLSLKQGTKRNFLFRLNRASQTYLFPVHLTDQLLPSAIFYATVGPLVFYLAVQRLVIQPYMRAQKEQ